MVPSRIEATALGGLPMFQAGNALWPPIAAALMRHGIRLADGDILVVAQKIVSKCEGRLVRLATVEPSLRARELAAETGKDARLAELILRESRSILRSRAGGLIVAEHRLGVVLANAGIDQSNIGDDECALLLPEDPDASARNLRQTVQDETGVSVGIVINDSLGRAWRLGTVGTAIGSAGLQALNDLRGKPDIYDRPMRVSMIAAADQVASLASLLQGEGPERQPVVHISGLGGLSGEGSAADMIRPIGEDLFR